MKNYATEKYRQHGYCKIYCSRTRGSDPAEHCPDPDRNRGVQLPNPKLLDINRTLRKIFSSHQQKFEGTTNTENRQNGSWLCLKNRILQKSFGPVRDNKFTYS